MEEFVIPLSREELLKRNSNSNQYFVSKLADIDSLPKHISLCEQEYRERGDVFIYKMFDYFFTVLHYWTSVDVKIREKSWDILMKSCRKSSSRIYELVQGNQLQQQIGRDEQSRSRNSVKMNVYLLCQMIEMFDGETRQPQLMLEKSKSRKKKTVGNNSWRIDLIDETEIALNCINQLFQCKIEKLWDPPIVEEDFVNLVTNTCYKLLENPDFCKNSSVKEGITKILINMIKNYNHNLSCSVKLVQLLHSCSHFASHLVYICRSFLATENMTGIIRDILTEICAYSSIDLDRNNQAASSFSNFLTEFGAEFPNSMIPILPQLRNKLDEDPFGMRNCVLTVLGEIVIQIYSKDNENPVNRDSLIEVIEDHVSDVSGFVRGRALAILLTIIEKCNLPLARLAKILKLLVGDTGAIFDTSSIARKNAIRIITCVVDLNVSKGLSHADLKERQDTEKAAMEEMEKEIAEMTVSGAIADAEMQIEYLKERTGNENSRNSISEQPMESQTVAKEILEKKLLELKGVIYILGQMMDITFLIESGLNDIQCMLSSKISTDVLEAISFFVKAKLANLSNIDNGIRKMLPHICSKEETIKTAITNAYKTLYLNVEEEENQDRNQLIIDSLSNLVVNPTFGELTCIEKLIINFTESGDIDHSLVQCLWDRFQCTTDQFSPLQKKYALIIFSMVANVSKPFMMKYFTSLINEGIPVTGFETLDLQLIEYICCSIQNLSKSRKTDKLSEVFRLPRNHCLFERLTTLCIATFPLKQKLSWIPMTNEAINTIYLLAENPNIICSKLVSSLTNEILIWYENKHENPVENGLLCQPFMLTRFIDVAGHIAMKQFIHFDVAILAELKRRNTIKEEKDQLKKSKKLANDRKRQTMTSDKNGENLEEEMGLVGASADDAEAEFIRKLCENELITDPTKLLNRLLNLVIHICSNVNRFKDKDLQKIASLSLGKMMLISSKVCMDNIDVLFNLATRSQSEIIRANLIVPLGDLIKRFTTKLEPYTPYLYGRLRDSSPVVRLNALNVLSHLILNDMIKVKGQISEMTTCIIDKNSRIVHLSKIFFQELALKDKALYNVMPDIISRLSNPQTGVKEDEFRTIMEYLMPFIQKKNQSENLFEKICVRLNSASDERSWRDLSYCLSLMPFNDTMLKGLQFNLTNFAGKLHVNEVFESINGIINNAKKNTKGEQVAMIEEMSAHLLKLREQGVEDEEANMNAQHANLKKRQRKSKKLNRETLSQKEKISRSQNESQQESSIRKPTKNKTRVTETPSSDGDGYCNDDNQSVASRRPRRACQQSTTVIFSDDDSDAESQEEVKLQKNKPVAIKSSTSRKRNKEISSEEEEEEDSD